MGFNSVFKGLSLVLSQEKFAIADLVEHVRTISFNVRYREEEQEGNNSDSATFIFGDSVICLAVVENEAALKCEWIDCMLLPSTYHSLLLYETSFSSGVSKTKIAVAVNGFVFCEFTLSYVKEELHLCILVI